jgi:hypothetical protein
MIVCQCCGRPYDGERHVIEERTRVAKRAAWQDAERQTIGVLSGWPDGKLHDQLDAHGVASVAAVLGAPDSELLAVRGVGPATLGFLRRVAESEFEELLRNAICGEFGAEWVLAGPDRWPPPRLTVVREGGAA